MPSTAASMEGIAVLLQLLVTISGTVSPSNFLSKSSWSGIANSRLHSSQGQAVGIAVKSVLCLLCSCLLWLVYVGISPPLDGIQYGGVHQRRYPNSLMVYNGKSENKRDAFGVPPILGNSHVSSRMRNITMHGHMTHDPHP